MAAYRSAGTGSASASTSVVTSAPAGVQLNDLLVFYCSSTLASTPTGWTFDANSGAYWRVADSTDVTLSGASGSYTFTLSGLSTVGSEIIAISTVDVANPIGASTATSTGSASSLNLPAITPALANTLLLFLNTTATSGAQTFTYLTTNTTPTYTGRVNANPVSTSRIGAATAPYAPAASSGTNTVGQSNTAGMQAALLAINTAQPITVITTIAHANFSGGVPIPVAKVITTIAHASFTAGTAIVNTFVMWKDQVKSAISSITNTKKS